MKRPFFVALLLATACVSSPNRPQADPVLLGPPEIQIDVVDRHAHQFDEDIGARPAGSQQEFAAATYITGHLQQAGYVVRLDAVPVADTVKSTNVIALAPGVGGEKRAGGETSGSARYLVAIAYDTEPDANAGYGSGLGLFLELARALKVRRPDHDVSFVAVGAELTDVNGGSLGSRRLAQFLLDEDQDPIVVRILKVGQTSQGSGGMTVFGDDPGICALADRSAPRPGKVCFSSVEGSNVYQEAGFESIAVAGDPRVLGPALLEFLSGTRR